MVELQQTRQSQRESKRKTHRLASAGIRSPDSQYEADMWGSPHFAAFNMVLCDGSVYSLPYEIDLLVHRRQHNRASGN
jgi:hypothetical protein